MGNIKELDHFSSYFKDEQDLFVIIGGTACSITMSDAGYTFRSTKDIDIVIIAHPSYRFTNKLKTYIEAGGYQISLGKNGKTGFYRFLNPKKNGYPQQLEIFAKNFGELELGEGQHIVPIDTNECVGKLSAILLEKEYFDIILYNKEICKGYSIIGPVANIALKARAYNELNERKAKGELVDSSDIKKHKKDAIRLTVMLSNSKKCKLDGIAKMHMEKFVQDISRESDQYFDNLLKEYGGITKKEIIQTLRSCFDLQ
ncbi:MAG: hypothetical protein WCQ53_04500 [bacterium]